jgi:histidine triad (HIT) family protein
MTDCIFCKIIQGDLPANITYQDDQVIVFDDIHPQAPVHKLIVPREHIETLNDLQPAHNALIGHMIQVTKKIAKDTNVDQSGYRVIMNCNKDSGQVVFHVHMHVLGGKTLG